MPDNRIYPAEIIVEVTNECNLRCRHCHFHGEGAKKQRPKGTMDARIWEKLLDEIAAWPVPVTLLTHSAGEPLLYRKLWTLLQKAGTLAHVSTGFMTNGMLLDADRVKKIMDLQVRWLALSIDGIRQDTHDFYRVNAHLPTIESHVEALIEKKYRDNNPYPQLHFNMVGYQDVLDQALDYVRRWLPHAASVMISRFRPVGSRRLWGDIAPVVFQPCPMLDHQMVIGFDGRVGLCCEDIQLDVPLGNVLDNTLLEIYNESPVLLAYRRQHADGTIDKLRLCGDCHVWGGGVPLTQKQYILAGMAIVETVTPAFRKFEKVQPI